MSTTDNSTYTDQNKSQQPTPLLDPIPANIPKVLRDKRRWAPWEGIWNPTRKGGKGSWDKVPRDPKVVTRGLSSLTKWYDFESALAGWDSLSLTAPGGGVGFNMTGLRGLAAGDLDDCFQADGSLAPWAAEIIEKAATYTERSPSGKGVRFFLRAQLAEDWTQVKPEKKAEGVGGIEVYGGRSARFVTVTGQQLDGCPEEIAEAQEGFLQWLETEYRKLGGEENCGQKPPPDQPEPIDVGDLPRLEELSLPGYVLAFLENGRSSHGDGSQALFAATIQLLEATATPSGLLRPDVVLSLLATNPYSWEVAERHRRGDDDRALTYLWKHHVVPGMRKVKPTILDFDNLDEGGEAGGEGGHRHGLETFSLADLAGQPIPKRRWVVDGIVPAGTVTLLYGDGGVGKSLLSLQLAVAMASGVPWVGLPCSTGRTLYLSAEDDKDEIHIRATDVTAAIFTELKDLPDVRIAPLAGRDAVLAEALFGRGKIESTKLWRDVREKVAEFRPALVIIDNLADVFAGNENERTLAQQFVGQLRGLCSDFQTTVVLLAHPSQSGMASGTGSSGSTAWHNSVRSRLYFRRPENATPETDMRVLESKKNNYGVTGKVLATVQWRNGAFHPLTEGDRSEASEARRALIREAFMAAFTAKEKARTTVSPNRSAAWAPSVFAKEAAASRDPKAPRYTSVEYAVAMDELLAADVLAIGTKGKGARATEILVRGKADLPQDDLSVDNSTSD